MLDFAVKLTAKPWEIEEADRNALREAGFTDRDIWDIAAVAGFFNMSNRRASGTDMRPNCGYPGQKRGWGRRLGPFYDKMVLPGSFPRLTRPSRIPRRVVPGPPGA